MTSVLDQIKALPNALEIANKVLSINNVIQAMTSPDAYEKDLFHWLLTGELPKDFTSPTIDDILLAINAFKIPTFQGKVKYISKGRYGCVYQPPISLDNTLNKKYANYNYVMKVTTNSEASDELLIATSLKLLDPFQEYFIYPTIKCLVDPRFKPKECNPKYMYGLISRFGGSSLKRIENNDDLLKIYTHLQKALNLLRNAEIIHHDISSANILIDEKKNARIIDFGMATVSNSPLVIQERLNDQDARHVISEYNPLFYTIYYHDDVDLEIYYEEYEHLLKFFNKDYVKGGKGDLIYEWSKLTKDQILYGLIMPNSDRIDPWRLATVMNSYYNKLEGSEEVRRKITEMINDAIDPYFYIRAIV